MTPSAPPLFPRPCRTKVYLPIHEYLDQRLRAGSHVSFRNVHASFCKPGQTRPNENHSALRPRTQHSCPNHKLRQMYHPTNVRTSCCKPVPTCPCEYHSELHPRTQKVYPHQLGGSSLCCATCEPCQRGSDTSFRGNTHPTHQALNQNSQPKSGPPSCHRREPVPVPYPPESSGWCMSAPSDISGSSV